MKKLLTVVPLALLALLTSCDDTVLTAGLAKDAVKKDASWETPEVVRNFKVGYYEIDLEEATALRQLQAAGMITLKLEKAVEERTWSGWYSSKTSYVDHYYAEVALTEEGKKYVFEGEKKSGRKDLLKDLKENEEEEIGPDYMFKLPKLTITTLLPNPSANETKDDVLEALNVDPHPADALDEDFHEVVDTPCVVDLDAIAVEETPATTPAPKLSAYKKAEAKVNVTNVQVILGEVEFVKAKEVYCPEEWQKLGKGSCKIITEFTDKTPFGFALGAPKNGSRKIETIELKRYEDLGWVVED